jgi:hypothetical protein
VDQNAIARAHLAGIGRRHSDDSAPSACCFGAEDAQERRPARIGDAFGKVVVPDHVGRLQVLMIDGVILAHQLERYLVVEVLSLSLHLLMRLRQQ